MRILGLGTLELAFTDQLHAMALDLHTNTFTDWANQSLHELLILLKTN